MNEKLGGLMERRRELLASISAQRGELAEVGLQLQSPLLLVDKGAVAARFLCFHPLLVAGAAAFFLIHRRSVAGLLRAGWRVWKICRGLASISAKLLS